ncbi:Uncharacterised protein [Bordetella pertussis]|nr:Uncharacterised protein [Bordetella pertussis]CFP63587.1 Uncharacterised protein [Bordetella pertussis]
MAASTTWPGAPPRTASKAASMPNASSMPPPKSAT